MANTFIRLGMLFHQETKYEFKATISTVLLAYVVTVKFSFEHFLHSLQYLTIERERERERETESFNNENENKVH